MKKRDEKEYYKYLDKLRASGAVNMFQAAPYVQRQFGVGSREACEIIAAWMMDYDKRSKEASHE